MFYPILRVLFILFFKLYLKPTVIGLENIPKKGPFIFTANHASYLDPPLVSAYINRNLYFMAREELLKSPVIGWVLKHAHTFAVKRHGRDLNAIKTSLKVLISKNGLVIFPEGTRTKNRLLKRAKPGVGFLVYKSRAPVIPCYIEGTFDAMPRRIRTFKPSPVKMYIGKPIDFTKELHKNPTPELYQEISDKIMKEIAVIKEANTKV